MIPDFQDLRYEVADRICTITMNRPEKKNALSARLVNELLVALETAGGDGAVRVVVLTGAGDAFCSGGDLSTMSEPPAGSRSSMSEPASVPRRGGFPELNLAFAKLGKPTIAKVRRYAFGGGLGLVAACTFAIAEDSAVVGTPEIDRGLFPMMIMANLFRLMPRRRGLEMVLTGERLSASEAVSYGLLSRAVPPEALDAEVAALAAKLASKPPQIVALGLEAFHAQERMTLEEALPYLEGMLARCFSTDDAREGMAAFLEKRKPQW